MKTGHICTNYTYSAEMVSFLAFVRHEQIIAVSFIFSLKYSKSSIQIAQASLSSYVYSKLKFEN